MRRTLLVLVLAATVWVMGAATALAGGLRPPTHRAIVRPGMTWSSTAYDRSSWYSATAGGYYFQPGAMCVRRGWSTRLVWCR